MKCRTHLDAFVAEYKRSLRAFNARYPGLDYVNATPAALTRGLIRGLYNDAFHFPAVRIAARALGLAQTADALRVYLTEDLTGD